MTGTPNSPFPTRTDGAATDDSAGGSPEERLADRTRELDELTRQHAATAEILDIIAGSPSGLQPVLDAVVGAAVRHCGADDAEILLRDGTEVFGAAHEGPLPSTLGVRMPIEGSSLITLIIRDGKTVHAPDVEALDPVDFAPTIARSRQCGVRALVGAPIRHAGEVVGFLLLRRREVGPFPARQIAMLETLAAQAGIAVANAGVIAELRESLDQQTATAEVLATINANPGELGPVFDAMLKKAMLLCGATVGELRTYDGKDFRQVASRGMPDAYVDHYRRRSVAYGPGTGPARIVAGEPLVHIPDLIDTEAYRRGDPDRVALVELGGARASLIAPLLRGAEVAGLIMLLRRQPGPFADRQIVLLQNFAAQAVIAIENARLVAEQREALERQTATAEVLQVINASPGDTTPVFETILQKAHALCGIAYGSLQLFDGEKFRAVATHSLPEALAIRLREGYVPGPNLRQLIDSAAVSHFPDIGLVDDPTAKAAAEGGMKTVLCVPLRTDGRLLGQIVCVRKEVRPFADREIALLQGFAAQAVIAMENARLISETREALDRQTAMAEVLATINANPGDLTPVFDTILDKALSLSRSSFGMLFRTDGERFWQMAGRNIPAALVDIGLRGHVPEAGTLLHRLVLGDDVAHLADITDDEAYRAGVPQRVVLADEAGARSLLIVALRKDGRLLGCIHVYRTEVRAFSEAEVRLVRSFADQAVIAMENARLLTETREALERQTAMAEVLAAINANPGDLTPVFDTILDKALSLSGSGFGVLARYDGEKFWYVAARNLPPALVEFGTRGFSPEPGTMTHRLVLGDDVAYLADIRDDDAYRAGAPSRVMTADEAGARSQLIVAMRKDGRLLGGLSIYRTEVRAFSEAEVRLVRSFADQAVIAMENARLLTETREALERQTATSEILHAISRSPTDVQPVLDAVVKAAVRFCGANDATISLRDGAEMVRVAHEGPLTTSVGTRRPLARDSASARAIFDSRTVHHPDIALLDPAEFATGHKLAAQHSYRAALAAPMLREGVAVGNVVLRNSEPGPFTPQQVELLETFAAQAVIAIENVRLFTELREALERQTAMAEVLASINANPGELTPVFDTILDKALSLSRSSFGFLLRLEDEKFWMVAERNVPPGLRDFTLLGHTPEAGTLLHRLVVGDDVAHLADIRDDEAYRAGAPSRVVMADEGGARSLLIVALRKDGRLLGCIQIYRTEIRAFSEAEITLVRSFADQAVIAMENARLLSETREALERQTATAEVLQVINAFPGDLAPVFDAILAKAHDLCGATMGSLQLFDGEQTRAVATSGFDDAFSDVLRRGTRMSRIVPHRHSTQIADLVELARREPDNPVWRAAIDLGRVRTYLAVPLVKDGDVLGLVVAARREVRPFTASQIALLENFAAQAVIAMENARLLEQIRQRQAELRVTFDNMGDGVAMFDAELRLAAWNRNFERIVGVPEDRLADRPSYAQYLRMLAERGEFGAENVEAELAGRLEHTERELRLERTRADGTVIEVRRNAVPGGGFVLIYSDVTERRKAEAAIREARDAAEAALERQTATSEILRVISQSPTDVQPVFDVVVRAAIRLCGAQDAMVVMRDGAEVVIEAHEGPVGGRRGDRHPLDGDSVMGRAIVDSRTVHLPDTSALGPGEFARTQYGMTLYGFRAIVAAPLMREGSAIGALLLRRPEAGPFTPRQIELLETFAAQAVIAIENVRLFTELRESLDQQTATARILQVISSSPTDAQPVFDAIAESAMRLLGGWSVLVWRYDGERMRIIASHGGMPGTDAASVRAALGERRPEDLAYVGDAILERVVQQIADVEAAGVPEDIREVARVRGWRANIAVPMLRDGAPIGVVTVSRKAPGAFVEREVRLLQTFAAQAVIAVDNVRLFTELRDSLEGLKAAQANLVQSEKMASLGQLTAGIAHEIKNPLNFVNNFAGLSVELLGELKEIARPVLARMGDDVRADFADTMEMITGNLDKIAEHGKRADGIVKSMLSHSRGGTGDWRESDINALVEEALNLAYHGARAQDSGFNVALERDFAPGSRPIEVVPQDVTRVFLNLFGNAFYAANKRRLGDAGYRPTLKVSTRDQGDAVEIRVRDNGTGIPSDVRAKLFQPFFTTKPTGEGTGLGLSISYDIVTQQHGGSISVESEPGSFAEFTVRLPRRRRAVSSGRA